MNRDPHFAPHGYGSSSLVQAEPRDWPCNSNSVCLGSCRLPRPEGSIDGLRAFSRNPGRRARPRSVLPSLTSCVRFRPARVFQNRAPRDSGLLGVLQTRLSDSDASYQGISHAAALFGIGGCTGYCFHARYDPRVVICRAVNGGTPVGRVRL